MTDVYLSDIAYAVGSLDYDVATSADSGRTLSSEQQLRASGFVRHRVCRDDESALDLAETVIAEIAPNSADAIIQATCLPENANSGDRDEFEKSRDVKHLMQYPASRLQARFGLDGAVVIGLGQQACTGLLGSLRVARALLATEPDWAEVICLTSDRFPPGAIYEQAYALISDGAAGCRVTTTSGEFRLVAAHHITNGAMVLADDDETVGSYFNYTHRLVTELLAKASMASDQVDWVVPQNTNVKAWQIMARLLGFDFERVWCPSLPDVAHMISGDNFVNLRYLQKAGHLEAGHRLLLTMAGYGMNWQGIILEKT